MKTITQSTLVAVYCIILSIPFFSCEPEESLDSLKSAVLKSQSFVTSIENPKSLLLDYTDCNSVCIEEGVETYYKMSDSKIVVNGNENVNGNGKNPEPNTKKVSYEAYNTETEFIVIVKYEITSGNSSSEADIDIKINGNGDGAKKVAPGNTLSYSINLPENWNACNIVSFSINQAGLGPNIDFNEDYALIGICSDGCEESFSYMENEDGSYTFSYISAEDLDGAVVKLTSPHISGFEALDGKNYTVNPGNGNGSPTVLSWTGDIEACQEITFAINFEADCDQTNNGFANIFTDFKVNDVSKKGDNPTIKVECSE